MNARILFGDPAISEGLKHVTLRDFWFHTSTPETKEDMKAIWEKALKETKGTLLPTDLGFIHQMMGAGIKVFEDEAKVSDFLALSNSYSKLWLAERKPEGLERIVERFWGAAGRTDMKLR